jgi:ubiquinone/menaquinone biosynthesis C-methylase UbiE
MQSHTVGASGFAALYGASEFYSYLKSVCAQHGRPIGAGSEILDFGVGWGRILRFFLKDVDPETLHGVDTAADYLQAARETGVPGHLHQIDPFGRLPHDDQSLDIVYAYSVFTHLPEHIQDLWLADIQRVLRPGGLFIATVEPPRFLDHFANLDAEEPGLHAWQVLTARKVQRDPTMRARLDSHGFVYIPFTNDEGEVFGDCVMTSAYVQEHWGKHFEILEWLDDAKRFWQAIVVARKRK